MALIYITCTEIMLQKYLEASCSVKRLDQFSFGHAQKKEVIKKNNTYRVIFISIILSSMLIMV